MRNTKSRKIIHYLHEALAGTTKNEHKLEESLELRNLKLGFYCIWIFFPYKILSVCDNCEGCCFLVCDAIYPGRLLLTFSRSALPSSSGYYSALKWRQHITPNVSNDVPDNAVTSEKTIIFRFLSCYVMLLWLAPQVTVLLIFLTLAMVEFI
jgi:hypothetical protein